MQMTQQLPESVMIAGCGYVGTALAGQLIRAGCRVGALTRNRAKAALVEQLGVDPVIVADLDAYGWHSDLQNSYTAVVNCVSSAGGGIAGYRKSYVEGQRSLLQWCRSQNVQSYVYTSSTSVYPQDGGVWVDEDADIRNAGPTGRILLESESMPAHAASRFNRWYVLRLSGIYGPGRHFLLNQICESKGEIIGSGDYAMNMIHLEDIVSAICAALRAQAPSGIYNITDDRPTMKKEVVAHLAVELNRPCPVFNPDKVPERLTHRGGRMPNRYISNAKAKAHLDWKPKYKSYREGYAGIISEITANRNRRIDSR